MTSYAYMIQLAYCCSRMNSCCALSEMVILLQSFRLVHTHHEPKANATPSSKTYWHIVVATYWSFERRLQFYDLSRPLYLSLQKPPKYDIEPGQIMWVYNPWCSYTMIWPLTRGILKEVQCCFIHNEGGSESQELCELWYCYWPSWMPEDIQKLT